MSFKDQDKLDELRQRLYERGRTHAPQKRHGLSDIKEPVAQDWKKRPAAKPVAEVSAAQTTSQTQPAPAAHTIPQTPTAPHSSAAEALHLDQKPAVAQPAVASKANQDQPVTTPADATLTTNPDPMVKRKKYRFWIVSLSIILFVVLMGVASLFLVFGDNTISGDNISIDVQGPFAVGGGEEIPLQVAIANQNTVPIEAATLIVEYPFGTQSATEDNKEIFIERFPLQTIDAGELVEVPLSAIVFGEENDEKDIKVAVEYRVKGSNATFFREAEPLRFKISSSPVSVSVTGVDRISSGQETTIEFTVTSNSPNPLTDVLIFAEYPAGFDYSKADPSPVAGQNTWSIDVLEPGQAETITTTGVITGEENAEQTIRFSVGVANERDPYTLASTFTTTRKVISIEQPFLALDVTINRDDDEVVAVESDDSVETVVSFTNSLSDSLFDVVITATLSGTSLSETDISPGSGFYDSVTNKITWDRNSIDALEEMVPGDRQQLNFSIRPLQDVARTPQVNMTFDVSARRVSDSQASEALLGTVSRVVKVTSEASLTSVTEHGNSVFANTGPVPPIAEEKTTYTATMVVENGSNAITGAVVTAKLPNYVLWQDVVSSGDEIVFDSRTQTLTWTIGELAASARDVASFQVAITPSQNQVGDTPVLVEAQQFRATDKFTDAPLRDTAPPLTTRMLTDSEDSRKSGEVLPAGS